MLVDKDWTLVVDNLRKSQKSWSRMTRILVREGAKPWVSGMLYKAVVRAVILFELEAWVITPFMVKALRSFQHMFSMKITGRKPKQWVYGIREFPKMETEM